jgi:hypothetical protein
MKGGRDGDGTGALAFSVCPLSGGGACRQVCSGKLFRNGLLPRGGFRLAADEVDSRILGHSPWEEARPIEVSTGKSIREMFRCSVGQMTIHRPFACPVVAPAVFVSLWRRKAQNSMPRPKQLEQKLHSKSTSYFASCPVRPAIHRSQEAAACPSPPCCRRPVVVLHPW